MLLEQDTQLPERDRASTEHTTSVEILSLQKIQVVLFDGWEDRLQNDY